jgi:general L-amino acid transport system permease protein
MDSASNSTVTTIAPKAPPKKRDWSWRSQAFRGFLYQVIAITLIVAVVWFLASNSLANMRAQGIKSGFDFLTSPAGFDIGESMIAYDSNNAYWKAFWVGVTNTLRVAILGIIFTTLLGTMIGVGRFSRNGLVRGLCRTYVEIFRNIPVLLQLLMWYLIFTEFLPDVSEPKQLGNVFLSKAGITFPIPIWAQGHMWGFYGAIAGAVAAWFYRKWAVAKFEATGKVQSLFWVPLLIVLSVALLGWFLGGAPTQMDTPKKGEIMVEGGGALSPEFMAVLLGLTVYTAAFVAEVVRAGIQSVPRGQSEAAGALGLSKGLEMRKVLLPQALRVIIPPMTNQYLNLTKNSSLAVAIGYPDVVSISNTAINQTGRAVECIALIMAVYLTTSLTTSWLMNWYNSKSAIMER